MSTQASAQRTVSPHALARRDLASYLILVVVLSAPWEIAIIRSGGLEETSAVVWVVPLMWMPALASVVVRLVTRQGFGDVSFRLGDRGRAALLRAPLLPLVVGGVTCALALSIGLVDPAGKSPGLWLGVFVGALLVNLVVVPGEEIGWRGFMVPRMVESGIPAPLATSGLVWGLWHVPLVLWGGFVADSPAPWASTLLLLVITTSLGYLLARQRMDTGSVWPPIALHVAWNVLFQAVFVLSVSGADEWLWTGETGVFTTLGVAIVALRAGRVLRWS